MRKFQQSDQEMEFNEGNCKKSQSVISNSGGDVMFDSALSSKEPRQVSILPGMDIGYDSARTAMEKIGSIRFFCTDHTFTYICSYRLNGATNFFCGWHAPV